MKKFITITLILLLTIELGCSPKVTPAVDLQDGSSGIREELTSIEVVKDMGNGINLGNTMEAYGRAWLGTNASPTQYETAWGQPVTTEEMIKGMKEAGFDTIRIPVAWTNTMDYQNGDYTIDPAYMARVKEIVDYARANDMYVIINDHWDGGWWGMFGSADDETWEKAMDMYVSIWGQISREFKDYSDYVIFESGNEELGHRLNDTDIAKDSGTLSEDDCYYMANVINQNFITVVRNSGGNNAKRFLLIAGFDTDINYTCDPRFNMPKDTVENRLLISVHYYDPTPYTIMYWTDDWGTDEDKAYMKMQLNKMQSFTKSGYGVVIGEYGVQSQDGATIRPNTYEYMEEFLGECDTHEYCPILWDCNFLYDKNTCSMINEDIANIYLNR